MGAGHATEALGAQWRVEQVVGALPRTHRSEKVVSPDENPTDIDHISGCNFRSRKWTKMAKDEARLSGLDLTKGIELDELTGGGKLIGYAGDEQVLLVRRGTELFAVGAHCTHYHAALVDGLVVDDTVRCPWHHACFSLRTGEALRPPALSQLPCFSVEHGVVFNLEDTASATPAMVAEDLQNAAPAIEQAVKDFGSGTYHKISAKCLPLYVAEFEFRYNNRKNADIFGAAVSTC
jgi:nitrite reductase/ring-hydroxylating ferredoxin subunit